VVLDASSQTEMRQLLCRSIGQSQTIWLHDLMMQMHFVLVAFTLFTMRSKTKHSSSISAGLPSVSCILFCLVVDVHVVVTWLIFMPHRNTTCIDTACCYRLE